MINKLCGVMTVRRSSSWVCSNKRRSVEEENTIIVVIIIVSGECELYAATAAIRILRSTVAAGQKIMSAPQHAVAVPQPEI